MNSDLTPKQVVEELDKYDPATARELLRILPSRNDVAHSPAPSVVDTTAIKLGTYWLVMVSCMEFAGRSGRS